MQTSKIKPIALLILCCCLPTHFIQATIDKKILDNIMLPASTLVGALGVILLPFSSYDEVHSSIYSDLLEAYSTPYCKWKHLIAQDSYCLSEMSQEQVGLLHAVHNGDIENAKQLLSKGFNPNFLGQGAPDYEISPLYMAIRLLDIAMIKLLIDYDADLFFAGTKETTVLYTLIFAASGHDSRISKSIVPLYKELLLSLLNEPKVKREIDQRFQDDRTLLLEFSKQCNLEAIELLLDYYANPKIRDAQGYDTLEHLRLCQKKESFRVLIKQGVLYSELLQRIQAIFENH